jgi:hypothetical protein
MNLNMETSQRAQAVVSFSVYAPKDRPKDDLRTYKFTLVPERGQWRIDNITYLSEPGSEQGKPKTLRKELREDINQFAHWQKPHLIRYMRRLCGEV